MTTPPWIRGAGAAALAALTWLAGCDAAGIQGLEEGVSTETQVRERLGAPERIWPEAGGARTLEYNRQPAGRRNYMITIGPDGVMTALRQVLAPHHFDKVQPGMDQEQVRRMLGKPARQMTYALKQQTEWDWNWLDAPAREMVFTVVFDQNGKVLKSASVERLHEGP